ncbi:hypothetical protein GWI33_002925, partial [Rhynchophorus ferrugineus]
MSDFPPNKNNDLKLLETSFLEYILSKMESSLLRRTTPLDPETEAFIEDLHIELGYRESQKNMPFIQEEKSESRAEESVDEDSTQDSM